MDTLLIVALVALIAGLMLRGEQPTPEPLIIQIVPEPEQRSGLGFLLPLILIGFVLFLLFGAYGARVATEAAPEGARTATEEPPYSAIVDDAVTAVTAIVVGSAGIDIVADVGAALAGAYLFIGNSDTYMVHLTHSLLTILLHLSAHVRLSAT
jgi:hypothetical protein